MSLVYKKKPIVVNAVGNAIDLMRETGTITNSSETSGIYTITSDNILVKNEVISIENIDYLIISASSSEFTIEADTGLDFSGKQWKSKAPYYMFGHLREIVSLLSEKTQDRKLKYQKYPLIILIQDFPEKVKVSETIATVNMIVCNCTDPNYEASDRYEHNFDPILYPLEAKLRRVLRTSKYVTLINPDNEIDEQDRLYWGKQGINGNDANVMNDHIDAIEINNLQLRIKNNC